MKIMKSWRVVGQAELLQSKKSNMKWNGASDGSTLRCPICGDYVSGTHYGIHTCESCKLFFKRTLQLNKQEEYVCSLSGMNRGACEINMYTRSNCRLCRFEKCISAGSLVPRYSWSRQGNAIILLGEYRFKKRSKHINQKHEIHWVCNKCDKGCKAKLTTLNDAIIKIYNIHDHDGMRGARPKS